MKRFIVAILGIFFVRGAEAQNIDVSTLPARDSVQLTIYNAEDITLVRETRHVTVRKGRTELQFSWANTLIDPTSVSIRFPTALQQGKGSVDVIDTRFPQDRPQALYWLVQSSFDGEAVAEISYFTSGISWAADYVGTVNANESGMRFEGFVTITNNSGEHYENASVRMVVGSINLVEKIAELAQRGLMPPIEGTTGAPSAAMKGRALHSAVERMPGGGGGGFDEGMKAKSIVKEGLSEYFLFTVPGTETIQHGWSKRLPLFTGAQVPLRIEYRYRPREYGDQLCRLFLVRNDAASSLGESPLPDGAVRLFGQTPSGAEDGLRVLAFLSTKYVPIGQEFEFNIGRDPQVILERLVESRSRDTFWFRAGDAKTLMSPTKGDQIDPNYSMAGWNQGERRIERVRNYRSTDITVAWRFEIDGDVLFRSALDVSLFDFRTPQFSSKVGAGETMNLRYEVIQRMGTNETQRRVELGDVQ